MTGGAARTDYQPLYLQVRNLLAGRIGSGALKPGEMLPNEFALAAEYGVSQGTMRKALTALETERLVTRHQGRGTYVARHATDAALFHFFRMVGLDEAPLAPSSVVLSQSVRAATREQARSLGTGAGDMMHAVSRIRYLAGTPAITERILVPVALMPGLDLQLGAVLQAEMYATYQDRFGITIARASERLAAVAATAFDGRHLGIAPGTPLIEIHRVAYDVAGRPVELRISRCLTARVRYAAEIA